jgi:hypothetical protein
MARPKSITKPSEALQDVSSLAGTSTPISKSLSPQDTPSKFKNAEVGYSGLNLFNGITNEEIHRELNWPYSAKTYQKMSYSVSVNACLSLYENLISKVTWRTVPPENATAAEKTQTKFVYECLNDMDIPFRQVIKDTLSSNIYGFAVLEKVYRRRNKNSGSMYSDDKIAIKKIALRNQETIEKFIFDDKGNEVIGVKQNLYGFNNARYTSAQPQVIVLPRSKFIHITTGRNRNDPYGKSPLRDVYLAWRYLEVMSEMEATGVSRDLQGIPMIRVPAQIMSSDASPEQKAQYETFKAIGRNLQANSQSSVIFPSAVDETTRTHLYDLSLLSTEGGKKSYDVGAIKQYYQSQIYTGLFADVLQLGNSGVGSFSLGILKNSLTGAAVESMLDNIVEAFNRDVIRQLYELNGWDISRACTLDYENLHQTDLDTLSKFYQRTSSVGLIEKDRIVLNAVRTAMGIDALPEDLEPQEKYLTDSTSRAGDGMKTAGEGTSTGVSGNDASSDNLENAA